MQYNAILGSRVKKKKQKGKVVLESTVLVNNPAAEEELITTKFIEGRVSKESKLNPRTNKKCKTDCKSISVKK